MPATATLPTSRKPVATYTIEVFRAYIPKWDEDKQKEVTIPVWVRRMTLHDPNAIGDSGHYKISCTTRRPVKGQPPVLVFNVNVRKRTQMPAWQNPTNPGQAWWRLEDKYVALKDARNLSDLGMLRWLSARIGQEAAYSAIRQLAE